jgi:hypothetical protein
MTPQEAVALFGSQEKMAKAFGVTAPAVLRWRRLGAWPRGREAELEAALERHKAAGKAPQTAPEAPQTGGEEA